MLLALWMVTPWKRLGEEEKISLQELEGFRREAVEDELQRLISLPLLLLNLPLPGGVLEGEVGRVGLLSILEERGLLREAFKWG